MPSLTPLHETYCRWDRTPPSQADVLEGLAQLVSTRLNAVMSEVIQTIQREVLLSVFGMSEQRSQKFTTIWLSLCCARFASNYCAISQLT